MRTHLAEPLTVERLADRAAISPRHLARAFTTETGMTPAKAVERYRLEAARTAVETTDVALEQIAESNGFGDAGRMRRAFPAYVWSSAAGPATRRARLRSRWRHDVEHDAAGPDRESSHAIESDENSFGAPDVAESIRVVVLDHFSDELRAAPAEPDRSIVDVLHGEHDA